MTTVSEPITLTRTVEVDPDDPVFAGHYPGFPLLPGAFVLELVHGTVLAGYPVPPCPIGIERAKFHRPVRPGASLRIEIVLTGKGSDLIATATASTEDGLAAELRLRYPGAGG